jgi:small-conductance mechanosensitive channel
MMFLKYLLPVGFLASHRRSVHSASTAFSLFAVLLLCSEVVMAQDILPYPTVTPVVPPNSASTLHTAEIRVDDRAVLEIVDTRSGQSLSRAERVNLRLERLIEREEPVERFTPRDIVNSDGQPLITIGGEPVLTVTPADAENNLMAPRELALMWGDKLSVAVIEARNARANPVRGVGYLVGYSFRDLVQSVGRWLPRLVGALLIGMIFWVLARITRWFVRLTLQRVPLDPNLRQLSCTLSFYGMWAAGWIAILSTLGIDSTSIATAVGISGFVLGFAFKDILSHFFAGLMLLMSRQFQIGGQIVVGEFEGVVERIELRALYLRTFDNRLVSIPNGDVFTSAVISNTSNPHRRQEFTVAISFEEDIQRCQKLAVETMLSSHGVLAELKPEALVQSLEPATVTLRLLFYIHSQDPHYLQVSSECIRRVKEALQRERVALPSILPQIEMLGANRNGNNSAPAMKDQRS